MTRKHFLALAALTLLVASFLRIWQLSTYPPGPHYDEAAELLITRSITFGGARFFPMVEAYQGREVLYYYLAAPLLAFVNDGMFSLRLLSVYCNLLTIAASVALGRAMFRGRRGVVVGLVIGVLMTLSFPMLWMSRQAFRSSTLPLMQSLALLFLWHGLKTSSVSRAASSFTTSRSGSRLQRLLKSPRCAVERGFRGEVYLIVAGLFAGGAVYTYNSSRLFPLWLLIAGIALLLFDRAHWRGRLGQGIVFFGTLALTAAPMALYAFQRPDVFFGRLTEVTKPQDSVTLAQSIILHARMFFIQGDPYFRYNIAGRPYFTLPEGILLLLGIGIAVYRLVRRTPPTERTAYLLALLSPLMVIPSVISVGGFPPSNNRSLGMVPLIFVLVALGAEALWRWLTSPFGYRSNVDRVSKQIDAFHILIVAVLLVGAPLTADLYFRWASDPALYYEADADLAAAARWLVAQNVSPGTPVYLAARDKGHPTVMIEPVPPITWLGTDSLFRPAPGQTGLYIFPRSAPPPADWQAWLAPHAIPDLPLGADGQPAFQVFRVSGDVPLPVAATPFTARNSYLTLAGLTAPALPSGGSGWISTAWHIDAPPPSADFTPLLMVEDTHGSLIYRGDAYMAGTDEWRAGETLIQRIAVQIPPSTPPGDYLLKLAWVARASNVYAPYLDDTGGAGAVWVQVGTLTVTRPAAFPDPASLPIGVRQPTEIAHGMTLLGWDAPPSSIRPGESLATTLYWQAGGAARPALTLSASLGDTLLWTGQPVEDYPTDQWEEGEVLAAHVHWTVPREQAAGNYPLTLTTSEHTISLGSVTVVGVPRLFEPPAVDHLMNVNFGGQILLYGYTLHRNGDTNSLAIIWKAIDNVPQNYKVFVHLVDQDGVILAQRDAMPQTDRYPTSLWLAGEFVIDTYDFPLFDDAYALRVGLYSPDSGARLNVIFAAQPQAKDYAELLY